MKKYIPLDFDEKGKVILGNAKNTPTPNKGIPAIYVESGSDEGKQGLKSISISPAITTTPALDSLFPIYWDDLTDEEKADGKLIPCETQSLPAGVYTIRVAPTSEWYATDGDTVGEKGAEIELQMEVDEDEPVLAINVSALSQNPAETEDFDTCAVTLSIFKR